MTHTQLPAACECVLDALRVCEQRAADVLRAVLLHCGHTDPEEFVQELADIAPEVRTASLIDR